MGIPKSTNCGFRNYAAAQHRYITVARSTRKNRRGAREIFIDPIPSIRAYRPRDTSARFEHELDKRHETVHLFRRRMSFSSTLRRNLQAPARRRRRRRRIRPFPSFPFSLYLFLSAHPCRRRLRQPSTPQFIIPRPPLARPRLPTRLGAISGVITRDVLGDKSLARSRNFDKREPKCLTGSAEN